MFLSKLSENLSVEQDACFLELVHEYAVRYPRFSRPGIDFGIPECAEVSLFLSTVLKCVTSCMEKRLFCCSFF